jgi:uncharacterized protein involved in exopolysaccharide biosynthesis
MVKRAPHLDLAVGADDEEGDSAPGPSLLHWTQFMFGAARRHWRFFVIVFLGGMLAASIYFAIKTPVYRVEARVLAQRQQAMPSVVRPMGSDEAPTHSAWELVHRRENLLALVKQARLPVKPARSGTDEDPLAELVVLLDKKLVVTAEDRTVNISVEWPDAQQSYRLVEAAVQNFLESRHLQEVTAIDEVIALLQGRAAALRDLLEKTIQEETRRPGPARTETSRSAASAGLPPPPSAPSADLVQLRSMLEAKQRAIGDVEEYRRRRLAELQAQLDQTRGIYSDRHPAVVNLRQDIEALSRESPQVSALRDEEQKLREEYTERVTQEGRRAPPAPRRLTTSLDSAPSSGGGEESERVRAARFQYQQMVERVNAAQVELDAARAAFKYRYSVVWPPEVPKKPVSPNPLKIFGGGFVAALLLALFATGLFDLRTGRVVERWQVERDLDIPVIGELRHK